ncbi:MAG: F0F1 ATP synthase subunit delta [Candidatus Omnitrophica bacterium]|nr:F0F1 ATP synthase subunit delta [Candidatus Omnitrophota bacterium]
MLLIQFIILQVIVFAAVLYFLKRILTNDTQSAVNRLDRVYQDLLSKQKELTQKIEQAEKEYKEKKDEATQISEKLKQEAMDKIREQEDKIIKDAKKEADEMVAKARASCDKIYHEIEKDVKSKNFDTVVELMNTGFGSNLFNVIHQELIRAFLAREKELDFSNVRKDVSKVTIKTAFPLKKEDRERVQEMVIRKLGRPMEADEAEDKNLIAGIALSFGTLLLDGSYANAIMEAGVTAKKKLEMEA